MTTQKTRCPYCASVFTVSNAQLAIRDGYTRCGKCFQVFKADNYLLASTIVDATGETNEAKKTAPLTQSPTQSEVVDLKKIDAINNKGFDNALDSFLDQQKLLLPLPLPSIIDFESTNKEKIDLTVLPNEHPEPEQRDSFKQDPDPYLPAQIEDLSENLTHEFHEEWLIETATPHHPLARLTKNPLAQPTNDEVDSDKVENTQPHRASEPTSETNDSSVDEDLMAYLNKNSVTVAQVKTKTHRVLPGMNDFHANQRSKKKSKNLPMHINTAKRNQALERLTSSKPLFKSNLLHIAGWSIASLLMIALLIAQYIFFNFNQLAANTRYQPFMHKVCLTLGCDVPLIDIEKIKMSGVLARHFKPSPLDSTIFTATMTNTAQESQPFPTLQVLILKEKKVVSGRMIYPSEYLKSGYSTQTRISVNHPTPIEFVLKIPREQIPVFALDPVK